MAEPFEAKHKVHPPSTPKYYSILEQVLVHARASFIQLHALAKDAGSEEMEREGNIELAQLSSNEWEMKAISKISI